MKLTTIRISKYEKIVFKMNNIDKDYEVIELRDLPLDEARKEILNFCEKEQTFDISIIADELKLDIFYVNNIIEELIEEGIIEEVE